MKKNLLYLCMVLCTLSFFASCSDDKKDEPKADYTGTYAGESLKLIFNDIDLTGKTLSVDQNTVTLKSLVPGEADIAIPCTFTENAFTGTSKTDAREITVTGAITDKKMEAKVTVKLVNSLAGNTYFANAQSLALAYETPKETITFMGDPTYKPAGLPALVGMMGGAMLTQYLQSVTFNADGTIVASYKKGDAYVDSPKGYAFYNVVDGKIFVSVNMKLIMSKSDSNPLAEIMEMLSNGLPLGLVVDGNKASFIVTRDMMMPFMAFMPILADMVKNDLVTLLAGEIPTIVKESTKFDLTLSLEKK